jgi:hypothetical protein
VRIAIVFGVVLFTVASAVVLLPGTRLAGVPSGMTQAASEPMPGGSPSQVKPPTTPVSPCQQIDPSDDPLVLAQRSARKQQNEIAELRHLLAVHEFGHERGKK